MIVCGTDLGPSGRRATDVAAVLARALDTSISLVTAAPALPELDPRTDPAVRPAQEVLAAEVMERHELARRLVTEERDRLVASGIAVSTARAVAGRPSEVLLAEARALSAKWIVAGPHTQSVPLVDRVLGSTAETVVRSAPCPVVVATGTGPVLPLKGRFVVVGVDGEAGAMAALRSACSLARAAGMSVHVVVGGPHVAHGAAVAAAEATAGETGIPLRVTTAVLPPAELLLDVAAEADAAFVALGARSRSALGALLLGSVASDVVRLSHVPVILDRAR